MSEKLEKLVEDIAGLTVMELSDLSTKLQDKFGVSAAMPMMAGPMMGGGGAATEAAAEKTEFNVVLISAGDKKIQVIKVVRELTGLESQGEAGRAGRSGGRQVIKAQDIKTRSNRRSGLSHLGLSGTS